MGTASGSFVVPLNPGRPAPEDRWVKVPDPTTIGRPAGWDLEMPILYLLLDTDGFRCLWGQRVDETSGRLIGDLYPVRHFHGRQVMTGGGVSTSFGNPISAEGFVFESEGIKGDIWQIAPSAAPRGIRP
jgi:hypothetical protein